MSIKTRLERIEKILTPQDNRFPVLTISASWRDDSEITGIDVRGCIIKRFPGGSKDELVNRVRGEDSMLFGIFCYGDPPAPLDKKTA